VHIKYSDLNLVVLTRVPKGVGRYHKEWDVTNGRPETVEREQCQDASQASKIQNVNFQTNDYCLNDITTVSSAADRRHNNSLKGEIDNDLKHYAPSVQGVSDCTASQHTKKGGCGTP
jgi:hypothetical protein